MLDSVQNLKIRMMTEGISISSSARRKLNEMHGDRPLTLADYASTSGIAICLGKDVWVNAPILQYNSNFVVAPSSILDLCEGHFVVRYGNVQIPARPLPVPAYYGKRNNHGNLYTDYCHTHTDRARISPIEGCSQRCKFCDMSYEYRYKTKNVGALADSVTEALSDKLLPAKHVLISGGTPTSNDYAYLNSVYKRILSEFSDVHIDIMMTPLSDLMDLDELKALGLNQLAINIELYNSELSKKYMPEKAAIGIDAYLNFIEKAVERLGAGQVRSLILVGLEDQADTLAGVEALAERGCEPVLSPFRPSPKTPLHHLSPPGIEILSEVYQRSVDIVERRGLKLGPRCIPCMHNTLTFPDDSGYYFSH